MEHIREIDMLDVMGNTAPEAVQERCRTHLATCAECQAQWDALGQTWDELGVLGGGSSPVDLLSGITAQLSQNDQTVHIFSLWHLSRVAAAILITAGAGYAAGKFTAPKIPHAASDVATASYLQFLAPDSSTGLAESGVPADAFHDNEAL